MILNWSWCWRGNQFLIGIKQTLRHTCPRSILILKMIIIGMIWRWSWWSRRWWGCWWQLWRFWDVTKCLVRDQSGKAISKPRLVGGGGRKSDLYSSNTEHQPMQMRMRMIKHKWVDFLNMHHVEEICKSIKLMPLYFVASNEARWLKVLILRNFPNIPRSLN